MIGAEDALSAGLINHLVSTKEEGLAKAKEILLKIFKNGPLSIGMVINCVNSAFSMDEDGYQIEANSFANCCVTVLPPPSFPNFTMALAVALKSIPECSKKRSSSVATSALIKF